MEIDVRALVVITHTRKVSAWISIHSKL